MSKRNRRSHSSEKKAELLRRHHLDKVPVSDLCDEQKLQPSVFYGWQRQLFANAPQVFDQPRRSGSREQELELRIAQLEARLATKDAVIAEISEEYVKLKKELGEP